MALRAQEKKGRNLREIRTCKEKSRRSLNEKCKIKNEKLITGEGQTQCKQFFSYRQEQEIQ